MRAGRDWNERWSRRLAGRAISVAVLRLIRWWIGDRFVLFCCVDCRVSIGLLLFFFVVSYFVLRPREIEREIYETSAPVGRDFPSFNSFLLFCFFFRFRFDSAGVWNGRLEYWVLTEKLASSLFIAPHNERRLLVFFSFLFLSFVAPSGRSLANDHRRGLLLSFFLFFSILESVLSRSLKMVFGFDWISTGYLFFRRDQFLVLRGFPIKKCCLCKGVRLR